MKKVELDIVAIDELVTHFAQLGVAQDKALLGRRFAQFNRLFDEMNTVVNALKRREGDQRRALVELYNHPNMQVRLKAAKHTLAVFPQFARAEIETIAASKWFPQAGEAGMCLSFLDDGTFKPT